MSNTDDVIRFTFGDAVSKALEVFFKNFVPFMVLAVVLYCPVFLYGYYNVQDPQRLQDGFVLLIAIMMELILYSVLTASLVYGTVQHLNGTPTNLVGCFGRGIQTMLAVLGVAIVAGIILILGFIALIIPGFIVMTMFWVVVPVAVIERQGVGSSLSRSRFLTYGHRWAIFGIVILLGLAQGIFQAVAQAFLLPSMPLRVQDLLPWLIGDWLITAFFAALAAVIVGVGYYLLRSEKEGADIKTIAAVFD